MNYKLAYPVSSADYRGELMGFSEDYETVFPFLKECGFSGIELLVRDPEAVDTDHLDRCLEESELCVAAIGTAPMQKSDHLFLLHKDEKVRQEARRRCSGLLRLCARYNAVLLIGKYRGMIDEEISGCAWADLACVMKGICEEAESLGVTVLLEPQNPSNINNIITIDEALEWIRTSGIPNLGILADTYHMEMTEASVCESLEKAGRKIGFFHMSDTDRKSPGNGRLDFEEIVNGLDRIGYNGFVSFEINQIPDSRTAAKNCSRSFLQN